MYGSSAGQCSSKLKTQVSISDHIFSVDHLLTFYNFYQTWRKALYSEWESSLLNKGPHPLSRGDNLEFFFFSKSSFQKRNL